MKAKIVRKDHICAICGSTMTPRTERIEEWHGDTLYVFENVPVFVCEEDGEMWLEGSTAEKLDELIRISEPKRTIEAPVFDLATA